MFHKGWLGNFLKVYFTFQLLQVQFTYPMCHWWRNDQLAHLFRCPEICRSQISEAHAHCSLHVESFQNNFQRSVNHLCLYPSLQNWNSPDCSPHWLSFLASSIEQDTYSEWQHRGSFKLASILTDSCPVYLPPALNSMRSNHQNRPRFSGRRSSGQLLGVEHPLFLPLWEQGSVPLFYGLRLDSGLVIRAPILEQFCLFICTFCNVFTCLNIFCRLCCWGFGGAYHRDFLLRESSPRRSLEPRLDLFFRLQLLIVCF